MRKDILSVSNRLWRGAPGRKIGYDFLPFSKVFSLIYTFFVTGKNMLFVIQSITEFLPFEAS